MDLKWRFLTTLMMWILASILTVIIVGNVGLGGIEDWVLAVPLGVALFGTVVVWESTKEGASKSDAKSDASGKQNETNNTAYSMALLMEMMDEDEREEFKHNLKNRILSGETVTNESLILDMEKRKRG